ncbi:MAG: hypothetical protein LBL86_03185 [Coriobacteriales bacterium]|jgi:hypothetical protein|nr:hypothetical protein [Coriobacteriales bacterium]
MKRYKQQKTLSNELDKLKRNTSGNESYRLGTVLSAKELGVSREEGLTVSTTVENSSYRTIGYIKGETIEDSSYRTVGRVKGLDIRQGGAAALLLLNAR